MRHREARHIRRPTLGFLPSSRELREGQRLEARFLLGPQAMLAGVARNSASDRARFLGSRHGSRPRASRLNTKQPAADSRTP